MSFSSLSENCESFCLTFCESKRISCNRSFSSHNFDLLRRHAQEKKKSSNKPQLTLMNQWPFNHTKYLRQKRRQKFLVRMEMVKCRKIEKQLKFR